MKNDADMVSKSDAWDALMQTPPGVQKELDRLRPIAEVAEQVALLCGKDAPKDTVCMPVPVDLLNQLRTLLGLGRL